MSIIQTIPAVRNNVERTEKINQKLFYREYVKSINKRFTISSKRDAGTTIYSTGLDIRETFKQRAEIISKI